MHRWVCHRGSENRSGLVWHAAEEGRSSCGQPCYSASADFHFGKLWPYHRAGDRRTETDVGRNGERKRREGAKSSLEILCKALRCNKSFTGYMRFN